MILYADLPATVLGGRSFRYPSVSHIGFGSCHVPQRDDRQSDISKADQIEGSLLSSSERASSQNHSPSGSALLKPDCLL